MIITKCTTVQCIGSCKSNYHVIYVMTAPTSGDQCSLIVKQLDLHLPIFSVYRKMLYFHWNTSSVHQTMNAAGAVYMQHVIPMVTNVSHLPGQALFFYLITVHLTNFFFFVLDGKITIFYLENLESVWKVIHMTQQRMLTFLSILYNTTKWIFCNGKHRMQLSVFLN